jgi:hypothetical protein
MLNKWNDSIPFMIEQWKTWKTGAMIPIKTLLEFARTAQSSDPRDRIYAFIGLATPKYNIIPSYETSNSLNDTLCYTTKQIILYEDSLDIIGYAPHKNILDSAGLPSWVPQWCSPSLQIFLAAYNYWASANYPAMASFHPNSQGESDRILRVEGIFIDQVAAETTLIDSEGGRIGESVGRRLSLINIDLEGGTAKDPVYFTGEEIIDAFVSTMHLGIYGERADNMGTFAGLRNNDRLSTATGLSFFRTPRGYIGLTNAIPLPTDLIAVISGASVPFILRRINDRYKLIGEAYVHGFMRGRAVRWMKSRRLKTEFFDII